ncbi:hypothetical protein EVAR_83282_1 [Eumeta japonica]|uniref:Fibronectin type-III domain-containing protein n=1 Tax=Eumeta variegata TaxID=151549 RepID=A0A4C1X8Q6_EUMVA|nr:hypothetical protein EVAR_83282_1 [Eumeta japonica]
MYKRVRSHAAAAEVAPLGPRPSAIELDSAQNVGFISLRWDVVEKVIIIERATLRSHKEVLLCNFSAPLRREHADVAIRANDTLKRKKRYTRPSDHNAIGLLKNIQWEGNAWIERGPRNEGAEPPPLANVTVHASTILALILWSVAGDGGHPIIDFTAQYRSAMPNNATGALEPWRAISPNHISPNSRQIDVYHLEPNTSYWFRVWATNTVGPGPPVAVLATTLYSDQDAELFKHFLEGAESFDTRIWLAAVCVVMGTLVVLAAGTCCVLCREWRRPEYGEDQDVMELVPNIILNPGFMETDPPGAKPPPGALVRSTERLGPASRDGSDSRLCSLSRYSTDAIQDICHDSRFGLRHFQYCVSQDDSNCILSH